MRRAASGNIHIARKFWHFAHQVDEAVAAVSGIARFALLLDGSADLVAASETVDLGTMLGKLRKQISKILQLLGDNVNDA
jgi:hypothetical protein